MKKLTRIEDVGDFLFGEDNNNYWVAEYLPSTREVKWHACDARYKLLESYGGWVTWGQSLEEMQSFVVRPINKQEKYLSDVAYKIRILEQKFLNRKQHAVGNSW